MGHLHLPASDGDGEEIAEHESGIHTAVMFADPATLEPFDPATFGVDFDIAIEELHDHSVTFVIEITDPREEHYEFFDASEQVHHLERLDETNYLITKTSCVAYSAIDRNHGILRRRNHISETRRVYTILFFRREDLRAIIRDFKQIGKVTLGKVKQFNEPTSNLTERQYEAVQAALELGYFQWPRDINSEELAAELGISRATFLEHLRKAQAKLLTDALDGTPHPRQSAAPESKAR